MEAYSQLAGAQCTHRIGFAPWQDAGHRVPGRGAQHVPTAREPTTTFQTSRPHVGGQLTGDLGGTGGDAPAQDPVPTPGQEPPLPAVKVRKETQSSTPTALDSAKAAGL